MYCLIVYTGLKYTYKIPKSFLGNRINLVHKNWQDYIFKQANKISGTFCTYCAGLTIVQPRMIGLFVEVSTSH